MSFPEHFPWKLHAFGDSVHPVSFAITIIYLLLIFLILEFTVEISQIEPLSLHFIIFGNPLLSREMIKMHGFMMILTHSARKYAL